MDVLDAIATRRSIRKFRDEPIPDEALEAILTAGTQAPSARPRQPWRFVAVGREQRADMMRVMREGMAKAKLQGEDIGTCQWTARAMGQAAATVFVFNAHRMHPWLARSIEQQFMDLVNVQSIGAAIQNMALATQGLRIGSLWVCDVFEVYEDLRLWMGEEGQMMAALSLGYADEQPGPRPRKAVDEIAKWM